MFLRRRKISKDLDDLSLIHEYREKGDREVIGILFERYTHLVFGICLKYLEDVENSKDAVMQIFEKLMEDLHNHEVSNFSSWLHSVARNHCLMHIRSEKAKRKKNEAFQWHEEQFMESDLNLHQGIAEQKEERLKMLEETVNELQEDQQICIRLFYFEEKSYQEIVEITGFDPNKVKSYLQNGKRNLKIMMDKKLGNREQG